MGDLKLPNRIASTPTVVSEADMSGDENLATNTVTHSKMAGGHALRGGAKLRVLKETGKPSSILKPLDAVELRFYQSASDSSSTDSLRDFIPRFEGVSGPNPRDPPGTQYIRIRNLLHDFMRPKVMDVKLGCRTFCEAECDNDKPRPDLYNRMCEMFPAEVTAEEHKTQTTSKFRWMSVRDAMSTIRTCCYRIDGVGGFADREAVMQDIVSYRTQEDTVKCFKHFIEVASTDEFTLETSEVNYHLAEHLLGQLRKLRQAMEQSQLVKGHEFIGSSLLFIADAAGNAGLAWIDFAKSEPVPAGIEMTHRKPWVLGNHEDGILSGMDSIIAAWEEVFEHFASDVDLVNCPSANPEQTSWLESPMTKKVSVRSTGPGPIPSMPLYLSRKLHPQKPGASISVTTRSRAERSQGGAALVEDDVAVLRSLPSFCNLSANEDFFESEQTQSPEDSYPKWCARPDRSGRWYDRHRASFCCFIRRIRQTLGRRKTAKAIRVEVVTPVKKVAYVEE
mmetsp:Transcript_25721/g.60013  ORF Transcript_25721/g.60013 Transcript_25721/m.60013 type:complete len:506 (+) Transcript_25721:162-1679(+)